MKVRLRRVMIILAVLLLTVPFAGQAQGVPAAAFDASSGQVVDLVEVAAGECRFNNAGRLVCPGVPPANVQTCLEAVSATIEGAPDGPTTLCGEDSECLLAAVQECTDTLGGLNLASGEAGAQTDGSCGIADALQTRVETRLANCNGELDDELPHLSCTIDREYGAGGHHIFWMRSGAECDRYGVYFWRYLFRGEASGIASVGFFQFGCSEEQTVRMESAYYPDGTPPNRDLLRSFCQ